MKRFLFLALAVSACSGADDPASASEDSAVTETAAVDSGTTETTVVDSATAETADTAPVAFSEKLSAMDLYSDIATKTIASKNLAYAPTYELWSDGAEKKRWVMIPAGEKIDNSDMDHWMFPVGTRFWKEFVKDGKLLETRLIERTGDSAWRYGSYVWNDAGTEAMWTPAGATNVKGTTHDVPKEADCQRCHDGEPGRILGFSAIQLYKGTPVSLTTIAAQLKVAPVATKDYGPPGTDVEKKALGYLHANCGNCHNPNDALVFIASGAEMRLYVDERDVKTTKVYTTNVNQPTEKYLAVPYKIKGGDAANSAVWARMNRRDKDQMPAIGTEQVHAAGLAAVKAWIDILPKP
jgi:hypothetical protein